MCARFALPDRSEPMPEERVARWHAAAARSGAEAEHSRKPRDCRALCALRAHHQDGVATRCEKTRSRTARFSALSPECWAKCGSGVGLSVGRGLGG